MNIKKKILSLDPRLIRVIKLIGRVADRQGIRAHLVGGFVRDIFLNLKNFDIDIVLEREGIRFAHLINRVLKSDIRTHGRFGTAVLSYKYIKIDIATFRKEQYPFPGSLPQVSSGSLVDDLARRDFGINAMAASINKKDFGELFDYFSGLDDLKAKQLRVLKVESFLDDPTRILRLARFKTRFGFSVEEGTLTYIKQAKRLKALEKMQKHRICNELILIFKEPQPEKAIKWLREVYGLRFIHKNLNFKAEDCRKFSKIRHASNWFKNNFPSRRPLDIWFMYFILFLSKLNPTQVRGVASGFGLRRAELIRLFSFKNSFNKVRQKLNRKLLPPSKIYKLLNPLSYEVILLLYSRCNRRVKKHIFNFLKNLNLIRIKLGGDDLKKLGIKPGPYFSKLLERVREEKLNLRFSTKGQELNFLKRLIKK